MKAYRLGGRSEARFSLKRSWGGVQRSDVQMNQLISDSTDWLNEVFPLNKI